MRRFRLFIATLSISSTVLFGLHEAVAQSIDAKSVERASLKYQSQKKLKKKSRKKAQALRNQKASENAAVKRRATKKNAAAKRNSTLQQTEIIAPWPVNKVSAVKPAEKKPTATFSGKVDFTIGEDTNIEPDKVGIKDNFFELAPSLSFKTKIFSGTVGATARDYSEQSISDIAKKTTAHAQFAAEIDFGQAKSTTTLKGLYNDEMWPDFIDEDEDGIFDGMPIRYIEGGIDQKFSFALGVLKLDVGGAYTRRDHTNSYSDYAPEILGERRYEQDFNELKGYSRVSLEAGKHIEFALSPSVAQKKYDDRLGRLSDGSVGGLSIIVPNYELITSQVALDVSFKFLGSTITPTAVLGQVTDQAAAAEDNSFYGYGLKGDIVILDSIGLKLTPSVMYKQAEYDNWTAGTANGEKRVDKDLVAGVGLSAMFTKNFGAGIKYDQIREKSTKLSTDENYRQQILGTTLTLAF